MHLCVAGWLDGGKAGYPTRYPSVTCGDNHVGLVLYKEPMDQSSKYDAYCYRLRGESVCVCVDRSRSSLICTPTLMCCLLCIGL